MLFTASVRVVCYIRKAREDADPKALKPESSGPGRSGV
jgi:hypothetical protein